MNKSLHVTAYECKAKQAEIFRRAAAGETVIVTNNGVPQVEIRKAPADDERIGEAIQGLATLQKTQLAADAGGTQEELRRMQEMGRD